MSGVKVTNERPARAIPDSESVDGTVVGEDVDWEPDTTTGIPPGTDPGDVLTWDGDSWEPEPPASPGDFELKNEGGQSTIKPHGAMGSTETFDPTDGNVHTGTLNADCTFTLNPPVGAGAAILELEITASGTHTWTWPVSVTWLSGVAPDPPADGLSKIILLRSLDGGSSWLGIEVGGSGSSLTIKDEGGALATAATSLDFVGAGVTASGTGAAKTITIPGGTVAALDDLTDVTITSPASGDRLRYDGAVWVNANLHDEPMIASDGSVMTDGLLNPMMHEVAW